jgi:nitrile hydratase
MNKHKHIQNHTPFNEVMERAMKDKPYRRRLISEPRKVLRQVGIDIPEDVEVRVREYRDDTLYIFLPPVQESTDSSS